MGFGSHGCFEPVIDSLLQEKVEVFYFTSMQQDMLLPIISDFLSIS
jgi:hypothetical protein